MDAEKYNTRKMPKLISLDEDIVFEECDTYGFELFTCFASLYTLQTDIFDSSISILKNKYMTEKEFCDKYYKKVIRFNKKSSLERIEGIIDNKGYGGDGTYRLMTETETDSAINFMAIDTQNIEIIKDMGFAIFSNNEYLIHPCTIEYYDDDNLVVMDDMVFYEKTYRTNNVKYIPLQSYMEFIKPHKATTVITVNIFKIKHITSSE